jgi:hypothetical protein
VLTDVLRRLIPSPRPALPQLVVATDVPCASDGCPRPAVAANSGRPMGRFCGRCAAAHRPTAAATA